MKAEQQPQKEAPRRLVTVEEVGRTLSMSRASVYKLMDSGELAWCKIGRSRRIPADAVERLIASTMVGV